MMEVKGSPEVLTYKIGFDKADWGNNDSLVFSLSLWLEISMEKDLI